jgi:hypothetical protein
MTTFNQNSITLQVEEYSAFNRLTGEASNIDTIVALVPDNVVYKEGKLTILGAREALDGEKVTWNDDLAVAGVKTAAELSADFSSSP